MQTEEPGGDYASRLHGWEGHFHCPHGNDGTGLAEGLADKLDKGSADSEGGTKVFLEPEAPQSNVFSLLIISSKSTHITLF